MSFVNFPAALPYFESLHKDDLLKELIGTLGHKHQATIASLKISDEEVEKTSHPFMDAFDKEANLTLTDNGALTYGSTTDPCLDLYYGISAIQHGGRDTLLKASWEQDPLLTLHIIFYTRSIHRGKSLHEPFFSAYCWLLQNHPQTAINNLHMLIDGKVRTDAQLQKERREEKKESQAKDDHWEMVEKVDSEIELLARVDYKTHGVWKDLCTLLTIYCQGELDGASESNNNKFKAIEWPRQPRQPTRRVTRKNQKIRYKNRLEMSKEEAKKDVEENNKRHMENNVVKTENARLSRLETRSERNKTVAKLLEEDSVYRALHFTIANLFASQLKTDIAQLEKNKLDIKENRMKNNRHAVGFNLSLAAKWAPSLGHSHDKHTFLATSIAEALYPPQSHQDKDESRVHYLNKVRELYRKEYLRPLRNALDITEHYMAAGKWDTVDIRHMPSVCLEQNIGHFFKHAPDYVFDYMNEVAAGTKKVSGATLAPNELVHRVRTGAIPKSVAKLTSKVPELLKRFIDVQRKLVDGQWDTLIESIRDTSLLSGSTDKGGNKKKRVDLGECLAICDVSGSMTCGGETPEKQPLNAAIGLSLVVSNLAKPPFKGAVITFTDNPSLFKVDTDLSFSDQVDCILQGPVGYNTDLCKVFTEVLLPMAKKHQLAPEDMVKRLFIFTDMEFDEAPNGMDELNTTQDFIRKQYSDAGYKMPELVWWNLCSANTYRYASKMNTPATKDDAGVSLLSGFSASMIKTFLDGDVKEEKSDSNKENDILENPEETSLDFMKKGVCHESFNGLQIVD